MQPPGKFWISKVLVSNLRHGNAVLDQEVAATLDAARHWFNVPITDHEIICSLGPTSRTDKCRFEVFTQNHDGAIMRIRAAQGHSRKDARAATLSHLPLETPLVESEVDRREVPMLLFHCTDDHRMARIKESGLIPGGLSNGMTKRLDNHFGTLSIRDFAAIDHESGGRVGLRAHRSLLLIYNAVSMFDEGISIKKTAQGSYITQDTVPGRHLILAMTIPGKGEERSSARRILALGNQLSSLPTEWLAIAIYLTHVDHRAPLWRALADRPEGQQLANPDHRSRLKTFLGKVLATDYLDFQCELQTQVTVKNSIEHDDDDLTRLKEKLEVYKKLVLSNPNQPTEPPPAHLLARSDSLPPFSLQDQQPTPGLGSGPTEATVSPNIWDNWFFPEAETENIDENEGGEEQSSAQAETPGAGESQDLAPAVRVPPKHLRRDAIDTIEFAVLSCLNKIPCVSCGAVIDIDLPTCSSCGTPQFRLPTVRPANPNQRNQEFAVKSSTRMRSDIGALKQAFKPHAKKAARKNFSSIRDRFGQDLRYRFRMIQNGWIARTIGFMDEVVSMELQPGRRSHDQIEAARHRYYVNAWAAPPDADLQDPTVLPEPRSTTVVKTVRAKFGSLMSSDEPSSALVRWGHKMAPGLFAEGSGDAGDDEDFDSAGGEEQSSAPAATPYVPPAHYDKSGRAQFGRAVFQKPDPSPFNVFGKSWTSDSGDSWRAAKPFPSDSWKADDKHTFWSNAPAAARSWSPSVPPSSSAAAAADQTSLWSAADAAKPKSWSWQPEAPVQSSSWDSSRSADFGRSSQTCSSSVGKASAAAAAIRPTKASRPWNSTWSE